jgi:TnpA family transposase
VLFYGKGGDIATNRREEQELSVACLLVLQAAIAYVNRLLCRTSRRSLRGRMRARGRTCAG